MNPDLTCDLGIISRGTQAPAALVGSYLLFSLKLNTGSPLLSLRGLDMFFQFIVADLPFLLAISHCFNFGPSSAPLSNLAFFLTFRLSSYE